MNTQAPMKNLFLAALMAGMLTACGPSKEVIDMQNQMNRMQPQQADINASLQQLRQEVAVLQGQLDDIKHQVKPVGGFSGIAEKITLHQKALETVSVELGTAIPLTAAQAQAQAQAQAGPGGNAPAQDQAGAADISRLTTPASAAPAVKPAVQPTQQAPATQQAQTKPAQPADTAQLLYDQGIKYYNSNKFKESLNAFSDFTTTFKKSSLIGNAWFWKGQSNFALKRYSAAVLDYEQVISHYKNNSKAATSYLRQGMAFSKLNNNEAARIRLNEVIKKFPKSSEAKRAEQLLKTLK